MTVFAADEPPGLGAETEIIVHGVLVSPYVRMVRVALEEKRLAYRVAEMAPGTGRSAEHLARHPFGRIPVIEDGAFVLYEAQAILRYLERKAPTPALAPASLRDAARMDQRMGVVDWYFFQQVSRPIVFARVVAPVFGRPVDEAAVAAALPEARTCLAAVANLWAGRSAETPDLSDIMLAPLLGMALGAPEVAEMLVERPGLMAWLKAFQARASMVATRSRFSD